MSRSGTSRTSIRTSGCKPTLQLVLGDQMMPPSFHLPPLALEGWRATRDSLWAYARCLGAIRRELSQPARHWSHVSLRIGTRGLTTGPMRLGSERLEIRLDLRRAQVVFDSETGQVWAGGLPGTTPQEILERARGWLARNSDLFLAQVEVADSGAVEGYEQAAAERYWLALSGIDAVMRSFATSLRGETLGPQLWPHHFDLAVLWLSGNTVPGEDAEDEEAADESMNFGFSTGDEGIPDPYFFATAYPAVDELADLELPQGGRWQEQGWQGAVLGYAVLGEAHDPRGQLLSFLKSVQRAGAAAMNRRASGE